MCHRTSYYHKGVVIALVLAPGVLAVANPPPPRKPDPISLDWASPSVVGWGNTVGDIYGENPPLVFLGFGWDVGGPGPIPHVWDVNYGLLRPMDNTNAISNGEINPAAPQILYFSGDDMSAGLPFTPYRNQAVRLQAAGDRYVINGRTSISPVAAVGGGGPAVIVGPVWPGPVHLISANQTRYNEIPSIPPPAFNAFAPPPGATPMDDMDALELRPIDFNGDNIHDTRIYFTLDPLSPSLGGGLTAADILLSPAGVPAFGLFAPFFTMGLTPADVVDALAIWDLGGVGALDPGIDYAIFSLAPGSPYLWGPDGAPGTADDFSPADIFATGFTGFSVLYVPAMALGMRPADNIDALDVELPRPGRRPETFDWWVQMVNIDIWLPPWFPPANDFHIELHGIYPPQIGELWTGSFPNATLNPLSDGVAINWSGLEVLPGQVVHVGYVVTDDTPLEWAQMYWTWNGQPIPPPLPDVIQRWEWFDREVVVDDLTNRSNEVVWVQRRVAFFNESVELSDLMVDSPLYEMAQIVDPQPLPLPPGARLDWSFPYQQETQAYVVIYDVFMDNGGQPGPRLATHLNAMTTIHTAVCEDSVRGDANCDEQVSFLDINPFVAALTGGEAAWLAKVPGCEADFTCVNDINQDGVVGFSDINPFVQCIVNGGCD